MSSSISALLSQAFTVLFMLSVPFAAALLVGGVLAGLLQTTTNIREPVVSYVFRLLAFAATFYFMSATIVAHISNLWLQALKP